MPNCFQLVSKETKVAIPFVQIDEEMRNHFKAPYDAEKYLCDWYDSVGWRAAVGKNWQQIADDIKPEYTSLHKIVAYLRERYDLTAWYSPR